MSENNRYCGGFNLVFLTEIAFFYLKFDYMIVSRETSFFNVKLV